MLNFTWNAVNWAVGQFSDRQTAVSQSSICVLQSMCLFEISFDGSSIKMANLYGNMTGINPIEKRVNKRA